MLRFNKQLLFDSLCEELFKKPIKDKEEEENNNDEGINLNEDQIIKKDAGKKMKELAKKNSAEIDEKIKLEKERRKQKKIDSIYDEKKRGYFQRLFPTIRNEKPGDDYYVSYSILM